MEREGQTRLFLEREYRDQLKAVSWPFSQAAQYISAHSNVIMRLGVSQFSSKQFSSAQLSSAQAQYSATQLDSLHCNQLTSASQSAGQSVRRSTHGFKDDCVHAIHSRYN
eukprot:scaffold617491_cov40-Prasinocladus_malaysianus.AAC.1